MGERKGGKSTGQRRQAPGVRRIQDVCCLLSADVQYYSFEGTSPAVYLHPYTMVTMYFLSYYIFVFLQVMLAETSVYKSSKPS